MGKYHFIAIGGIGMSGLAKYLLQGGHQVSGSDISDSKYTKEIKELGGKVYIGHDAANVPADAIIIKSTAIRDDNPELQKAKELDLKIYHRSDLLEHIASSAQSEGKCFIGFSGTHGKTTTSGLASYVLERAGLEPSFVDGGILPDINTNAQHKDGKHFIAELDESDGTIVKYSPDILVINNLEEDHIDYYVNGMSDILKTFELTVSKARKIIVNTDNSGVKQLSGNFITFGLNTADYTAKNIKYTKDSTVFDVYYHDELITDIKIQLTGVHNIYNTLAVVAALKEAGVDIEYLKKYFYDFTGMGRRFQKICEFQGVTVYDDYAHHPTEIRATLDAAAQKFGRENIVAVFQPHRYTRLKNLWSEFLQSFKNAGRVIVTDVYAASEDVIDGINGKCFASELAGSEYISGNIDEVAEKLISTLKTGDVVIGLGAGTITKLGKSLEKCESQRMLNCK